MSYQDKKDQIWEKGKKFEAKIRICTEKICSGTKCTNRPMEK